MESNWASVHLQTIRTLMERTALYRRALAPIMIVAGITGLLAATLACFVATRSNRAFSGLWLLASVIASIAAFILVRRQALKDKETLWSPPTRRVTQALLPAFFLGLIAGLACLVLGNSLPPMAWGLAVVWTITYGFALHAAGFFMERGIKIFGWLFVIGGAGVGLAVLLQPSWQSAETGHYVMGGFFGMLQLAYGIYLYFTEKR